MITCLNVGRHVLSIGQCRYVTDRQTDLLDLTYFGTFSVFELSAILSVNCVCLCVLLLYVPSQQLWSLRDGQFT